MIDHSIDYCLRPKYGLKMFETHRELMTWLDTHADSIRDADGVINLSHYKITFPNGSRLHLGHTPEDFNKWMGCRFTFIHGATERYNTLLEPEIAVSIPWDSSYD